MNIIDYISSLAERGGVDLTSDALKPILTNPALAAIEVPAELETATSTKFLTEEEARINPNLKKYFSAMALNVADKNLRELAKKHLDDTELADINKDDLKTLDIAQLIVDKVKAKAASSNNGSDKKQLLDEITKLQGIIAEKEAALTTSITERDNHWITTLGNEKIDAQTLSYNYAGEVPKNIQAKVLKEMFIESLKADKGLWRYADGKIGLFNAEHPELPLSIGNKQVSFEDYMTRLAEPLVAKHNPPAPAPVPTPESPKSKQGQATANAARLAAKELREALETS